MGIQEAIVKQQRQHEHLVQLLQKEKDVAVYEATANTEMQLVEAHAKAMREAQDGHFKATSGLQEKEMSTHEDLVSRIAG